METKAFKFLNTTNAPGLSEQAAKQVRGHVTSLNFAKRRRRKTDARIAKAQAAHEVDSDSSKQKESLRVVARRPPSDAYQPLVALSLHQYGQLLPRFKELAYLDNRVLPRNASEASWFNLIASEPALVEASLAVVERYWSPDAGSKRKSETHAQNAFTMILKCIQSSSFQTDGILAAILTMAFGQRLANNDIAWITHVEGLARVIQEKTARGTFMLPSWFHDLLVFDSINDIFGIPRMYHCSIINALNNQGGPVFAKVIAMSRSLGELRRYAQSPHEIDQASVEREVEQPLNKLLHVARSLRSETNPYVRAATISIEIIVHLSQTDQSTVDMAYLAACLREALCQLPVRPCVYMELTSCHMIIGAAAAREGSQTRKWFVHRLKRAMRAIRMRGWDGPKRFLEGGFLCDSGLAGLLRGLWNEVDEEAQHHLLASTIPYI